MTLRTITGIKSQFVGFTRNVTITIGDLVIRVKFYIIDTPGLKVVLGIPVFRKARITFRYLSDFEGGAVFAQLIDPSTGVITSVRINKETGQAASHREETNSRRAGIITELTDKADFDLEN